MDIESSGTSTLSLAGTNQAAGEVTRLGATVAADGVSPSVRRLVQGTRTPTN